MLRRFEAYSLRDDAPPGAVTRLRHALRDCGRYIPEVLHAAIGANRAGGPLALVWEHAYASPEAYQRYMVHPFHAAVLDRFLLSDSPERIVSDNGLGAGLFGYACDTPVYRQPGGLRRLVLLQVAADASAAQRAALVALAAATPGQNPGMRVSVLAENTLATRWLDGVTPLAAHPRWTHLWEQGFATAVDLAAYRVGGAPLACVGPAAWEDGAVRRAIEIEYQIEPGFGYDASA